MEYIERGKAEIIRIILAITGTDYEWVPLGVYHPTNKSDEFKNLVSSGILPFDMVPLWQEPGGINIVQSHAIIRHLARTKGLYGKDVKEAAQCDIIYEGLNDIIAKLNTYRHATPENKEQTKKNLLEVELPKWYQYYERLLQKNNGGNGYFVGDNMTYADIAVWFLLCDSYPASGIIKLDNYPLLQGFKKRMESNEKLAAYIADPKRYPLQSLFLS